MADLDPERVKSLIVLLLLEYIRGNRGADDDADEILDQLVAEAGSERQALSLLGSTSVILMSVMLRSIDKDIDIAEILQGVTISGFDPDGPAGL